MMKFIVPNSPSHISVFRSLRHSSGGKPPQRVATAPGCRLSPDPVPFTYPEPTPRGSASTSPMSTTTPAPSISSSSNNPFGETH
jgi:hypothetical protein